jgi:glycosyltransferase involved in cell wall biosynthesis
LKSPRVLLLPSYYPTQYDPLGGIFVKEQAAALIKSGFQLDVLFIENRRWKNINRKALGETHFQTRSTNEDGIPTIRQRGWNLLMRTALGGYLWALRTRNLFNQYKSTLGPPHIIHAHNSLWAGYAAAKIWEQHKIPYVITEHSTLFPSNKVPASTRSFIKKAYANSRAVIAVSPGLGNSLLPYLADKKPVIISNLIDTVFFGLPTQERTQKPFTFLSVGNLIPRKGFDILIKAFDLAFHDEPDVNLNIGGAGPELEKLRELCQTLKITQKVTFLGALSRVEVRNAMWRANTFVLSSYMETFGIVVIEALSTGLPVIATCCGGPEYILTPQLGMLTAPGDVVGLAQSMKAFYYENHFSPFVLHSYVEEKYSEYAIATLLEHIYEENSN